MFAKTTRNPRSLALITALLMLFTMTALPAALAEDSWYKDQAKPLLKEMQELMLDTNYTQMVGGIQEASAAFVTWRQAMDEQEPTVHLFKAPTLENTMRLADNGSLFGIVRGMGETARKRLDGMSFVLLLNYITSLGTQGQSLAGMMVAGNAVSVSNLLEMPEQFEDTVVVYEYDTFVVPVLFKHEGAAVTVQTFVSSPALLEKLREIK